MLFCFSRCFWCKNEDFPVFHLEPHKAERELEEVISEGHRRTYLQQEKEFVTFLPKRQLSPFFPSPWCNWKPGRIFLQAIPEVDLSLLSLIFHLSLLSSYSFPHPLHSPSLSPSAKAYFGSSRRQLLIPRPFNLGTRVQDLLLTFICVSFHGRWHILFKTTSWVTLGWTEEWAMTMEGAV